MNYYIDIIDTTNGSHVLAEEHASTNALVLSWQGNDAKDELFIVGSTLAFNMAAPNLSMGYFIHLFTGNETKYRVEIRAEDDDALIWNGFLLPDTYQEPFTNKIPFINVTASDGLGRLKGKYLPDDFYTSEKSVIQVLQACLEATALSMPLKFAPAIQHVSFKKYHTIFLDGTLLFKGDKKQTCYTILDNLLQSMVCMVYQSLGYWYVEGLNKRHLAVLNYDEYAVNGSYLGEVEHGRIIKQLDTKMFEAPLISMVPAYKKVVVSYDIEQPKLSENIVQETNDGWASTDIENIYADAFFPHNGKSFAIASAVNEYKVRFQKHYSSTPPDSNYKMSLVNPVYVDVSQEVAVELDFNPSMYPLSELETTTIKIQIALNGTVIFETVLYSDPTIEEADDVERAITYVKQAFVISESGYLDVFIYKPISNWVDRIARDGWVLNTFKVKVLNQREEYIVEDEIAQDYTLEKNVELVYADEYSGLNPSFLLEKLNDTITETYNQDITVYNEFVSEGNRYIQVKLIDANLCDSFKTGLFVGSTNIGIIKVIYNWLGATNEHMVQIDTPVNAGNAYIKFQKKYSGGLDRSAWQSWTDAVYQIENTRYGQAVSNIYRRMFLEPYEKIDGTAKKLISFNDLIAFTYIDARRYVPVNVSIDLDRGTTNLMMVLNYYHDNSGGVSTNISPILNVIEDFCMPADGTTINLTSEAYDPDGFIVSHYWEIITGSGDSVNFETPNITLTNLPLSTFDFVFRCTVVDNDGATVSKDVNVCRITEITVLQNYMCGWVINNDNVPPRGSSNKGDTYRKGVELSLSEGTSADYNFNVKLKVEGLLCSAFSLDDALDDLCSNNYIIEDSRLWRLFGGGVRVFKNSLFMGHFAVYPPDNLASGYVEFAMNSSDTVLIMMYGYKSGTTYMNTKVTVEEMVEFGGAVEVSNEGLEFYLTETYTLQ